MNQANGWRPQPALLYSLNPQQSMFISTLNGWAVLVGRSKFWTMDLNLTYAIFGPKASNRTNPSYQVEIPHMDPINKSCHGTTSKP
ncbi:hypothetical protein ACN38_g10192 [Penicillium nordicum]|uniref:Uncharacterized protein n=1 Tax=Penicillium nordicum TaxID=229535 RepID=A0A0M8P0V5_9EURO|nr:hypothetical protein ACN38_g10192 [Penicillium nordicum]